MNKSTIYFLIGFSLLPGMILLIKLALYSIGQDIAPNDPYYDVFQQVAYMWSAEYWIEEFFTDIRVIIAAILFVAGWTIHIIGMLSKENEKKENEK